MQVLIALTATIGIAPCVAQAQGNDPGAGSPSGTIYEIPLDNARSDAAPRDRRGTANQPSPASPIHSENGFGSSAQVPGAPAQGSGTRGFGSHSSGSSADGAGTGGSGSGTSGPGGSGTSGTGGSGTSGTAGSGTSGSAGSGTGGSSGDKRAKQTNVETLIRPASASAAAPSTPSSVRTYVLLGLAIGVGLALGAAAHLAARRR